MQMIGLARFFHGVAVSPKWGGVSQLNSGDASVTVSAANVQSGGPVLLSRLGSNGNLQLLEVDSVVDAVSFAVKSSSGSALASYAFSWLCARRN